MSFVDDLLMWAGLKWVVDMEVLQWAHANGCPWDESTCSTAAAGEGAERIRRQVRAPRDFCAQLAARGLLTVLRWARANGCPWDEDTCIKGAEGGHLEVLQWVRANGCPWDWQTCAQAAEAGEVEVLEWARANGCPWDWRVCSHAAAGGGGEGAHHLERRNVGLLEMDFDSVSSVCFLPVRLAGIALATGLPLYLSALVQRAG
jgi:hypothetical protein